MTLNDIHLLTNDLTRQSIEDNIERNPSAIALDKRVKDAPLIATQVKYLQRAQTKLPSYYAARCIIPQRAFEQATSETVASKKEYSGSLCIDLTCGLGVDSFHFSKTFDRVIAVERDESLASVARLNFSLLGVDNIEVVAGSAEEFIAEFNGCADLIYADPDRRNTQGKRFVNPMECSPNVVELMPRMFEISPLVVIKNSPMEDVTELFGVLGECCQQISVISERGECREILAECSAEPHTPVVSAISCDSDSHFKIQVSDRLSHAGVNSPQQFKYIVVPDAAIRAAHLVAEYFQQLGGFASHNGYAFCDELPDNLMGRGFVITAVLPYNKQTKQKFAEMGISRANIHLSDINTTVAEACRRLGIREGGTSHLFLTTLFGEQLCIVSK